MMTCEAVEPMRAGGSKESNVHSAYGCAYICSYVSTVFLEVTPSVISGSGKYMRVHLRHFYVQALAIQRSDCSSTVLWLHQPVRPPWFTCFWAGSQNPNTARCRRSCSWIGTGVAAVLSGSHKQGMIDSAFSWRTHCLMLLCSSFILLGTNLAAIMVPLPALGALQDRAEWWITGRGCCVQRFAMHNTDKRERRRRSL